MKKRLDQIVQKIGSIDGQLQHAKVLNIFILKLKPQCYNIASLAENLNFKSLIIASVDKYVV